MNYQAIYNSLIQRGKNRNLEGYCERHHIIPRCMKGNDDPENLVKLTAREHFIAHRLLTKIYPENNGLKSAVFFMTRSKNVSEHLKITSRTYQHLRIESSIANSILQKGRKLSPESLEKGKQTRLKNNTKRFKSVCVVCNKEYKSRSSIGKICDVCRKPKECKCGCGGLVKTPGIFFMNRHRPKKKNYERVCTACNTTYQTESSKSKFCSECRKPKPCRCGCKQMVVYPGRYFKASHDKSVNNEHKCTCQFCNTEFIAGSAVGKTCPECAKPRLCKCGCGAIIKKPGAYFRTKAHKVYFEEKLDK